PVESAREMLAAVEAALPADVAVMAAAVADWRVETAPHKLKKGDGPPNLSLAPNPDILATVGRSPSRPTILVGFAAETENVVPNAAQKRERKGCDFILANDVSAGVFGSTQNTVHVVGPDGAESWPTMSKDAVAERLVATIAQALDAKPDI
ncbi:MAG: phosphopantothenoylcysteine decarboxylase, partial [Pseudomonadota bacterium]